MPSRAGSLPQWKAFLLWERACSRSFEVNSFLAAMHHHQQLRLRLAYRADPVRFLRVEVQRIATTEQHSLVHKIHLHLPFVDKQELFPKVLLEGSVGELGRRVNDERQQAAFADLTGQYRVAWIVVAGTQ